MERQSIWRAAQRLVALVLLVVFSAGPSLTTRFQPSQADCSMACCKRKLQAQCCKRHTHSLHKGNLPVFRSSPTCVEGCAMPIGIAASVIAIEVVPQQAIHSHVTTERLIPRSWTSRKLVSSNPSHYQRPPPFLLS